MGACAAPGLCTDARTRAQLCVTCRIVRPLRAKHCAASDRCIEQFDHFCPWVGNAIGRRNRALFLLFLWLELGALVSTAAVAGLRLHAATRRARPGSAVAWAAAFLVVDCFLALSVGALAVTQARRRARLQHTCWWLRGASTSSCCLLQPPQRRQHAPGPCLALDIRCRLDCMCHDDGSE